MKSRDLSIFPTNTRGFEFIFYLRPAMGRPSDGEKTQNESTVILFKKKKECGTCMCVVWWNWRWKGICGNLKKTKESCVVRANESDMTQQNEWNMRKFSKEAKALFVIATIFLVLQDLWALSKQKYIYQDGWK